MLTTRNNQNKQAAASAAYSLAQSLMTRQGPQIANALGKLARDAWNGRGASMAQPSYSGGAIQSLRALPSRRRNNKKKKTRKSRGMRGSDTTILRSPALDRIRVMLKDVREVDNGGGASSTDQYFQIAVNYTAGNDMATWLPRAATLAGSFRFFRVNKITMTFQPTQAYTATGYVALGVDPAPSSGAPGSLTNVIRHDPSTVGDVKDRHYIIWTPGDDEENIDKLSNAVPTAPATCCQGSIQLYSANNLGVGAQIGFVMFEVDIEFYGLF